MQYIRVWDKEVCVTASRRIKSIAIASRVLCNATTTIAMSRTYQRGIHRLLVLVTTPCKPECVFVDVWWSMETRCIGVCICFCFYVYTREKLIIFNEQIQCLTYIWIYKDICILINIEMRGWILCVCVCKCVCSKRSLGSVVDI